MWGETNLPHETRSQGPLTDENKRRRMKAFMSGSQQSLFKSGKGVLGTAKVDASQKTCNCRGKEARSFHANIGFR